MKELEGKETFLSVQKRSSYKFFKGEDGYRFEHSEKDIGKYVRIELFDETP